MKLIAKPLRIEPAFDDREQIRAMFERNAPYRALAAYAPEGLQNESRQEAKRPVLPWFRGDWALGGEPLVEGAELILNNKKFHRGCQSRIRHSTRIRNSLPLTLMGLRPLATRTWTTRPFSAQRA